MIASGGNGGSVPPAAALPWLSFARISSATNSTHFLQRYRKAPGDRGAAYTAIASGRQAQPPVKASLRQLEPMDGRGPPLSRHQARAGNDEIAVLNHRLHSLAIDAGQRDQHHDLEFGFQNID